MKPLLIPLSAVLTACFIFSEPPSEGSEKRPISTNSEKSNTKIQAAILLDVSNSMDGLIEQAKSQLWKIVNELAGAKCDDGSRPNIKIALYEYGNDGLPSSCSSQVEKTRSLPCVLPGDISLLLGETLLR